MEIVQAVMSALFVLLAVIALAVVIGVFMSGDSDDD